MHWQNGEAISTLGLDGSVRTAPDCHSEGCWSLTITNVSSAFEMLFFVMNRIFIYFTVIWWHGALRTSYWDDAIHPRSWCLWWDYDVWDVGILLWSLKVKFFIETCVCFFLSVNPGTSSSFESPFLVSAVHLIKWKFMFIFSYCILKQNTAKIATYKNPCFFSTCLWLF